MNELLTKETQLIDVTGRTVQRSTLGDSDNGVGIFSMLVQAGQMLPPWWSPRRDIELRRFIMNCDYLKGTIYSMIAKMTTIPFSVRPKDKTVSRHVEQAQERTDNLTNVTEYFRGWNVGFGKFLYDLYTQDNGAFFEVIGGGNPESELIGWPLGLAHIDSGCCQRTSNPEYPVLYVDPKSSARHKLHHTRVIEFASMASPDVRMNSVGLSAVSRCTEIAQNLVDIMTYEQEKMGSRPPRILLAGSYISTAQINEAFKIANQSMTERGLTRFAQIVAIGRQSGEVKLEKIDLTGVPDGFDKDASIKLGMAVIALAWGIDYRELWPATVTGATKSDASVQHMKAKGKGPGEIIQMIERLFNQKYLPPHLEMKFDFQDDESDALQAEVQNTRSQAYTNNLNNGSMTIRIVREKMLETGELSQSQFEQLELEDGRLEDGSDVLNLFGLKDADMQQLLALGVANPLDIKNNPTEVMTEKIDEQLRIVSAVNINVNRENIKKQTRQAMAALRELKRLYEGDTQSDSQVPSGPTQGTEGQNTTQVLPEGTGQTGSEYQEGSGVNDGVLGTQG